MAVRTVHILPDPILRQKAKRVGIIDRSIEKLIDDMIETMRSCPGVGMAAPQVGVSLRIAVIELPGEKVITLINPQVIKREGERIIEEGCLSIPGYKADVTRSEVVKVKAMDRSGKEIRIKGQDMLAQALEHEIDHLNGILYIDLLESLDELQKVTPEENVDKARSSQKSQTSPR